ncbi:viral A-type inclusion protein [Reticulomyxa filosa]|uniref:Viral A-type inclusion protein n=1 Tax=Reticulomyxa filosa TaxID=46433 RepID=X6N3Z4_RETFI|nr:viral A-type inclusion protein [Reticulomyxa filosa]|eukprot:ETO20633.1 viral A-type inclusion protein [Reticulomyxa filosa]
MLHLNVESEEKNLENQKETFSLSDCFKKEWLSLTNKQQKLNMLICCICNQITNNAMELHCNEHEKADQVYLVGEECLQNYLKQNNEKCPIQQHDRCEFSQGKAVRKLVSELLVICPRQFDLNKRQSNKGIKFGEDEENWSKLNPNSNSKNNCNCNYKGKMKDLKDHMDKSCNLIPIKQNIPSKIVNELNVMSEQIKELQNVIKVQTEQVKDLKAKSLKKDEQIFELTKDIQQLKTEIVDLKQQQNDQIEQSKIKFEELAKTNNKQFENLKNELQQYQIKFDEYKKIIETNAKNQNTNVQQVQLQINTQIEEQKNEQKEKEQNIAVFECNKNCGDMLSFIQSPNLKNGVDFLLVIENEQTIHLKNNEWNNYNFGIFLLGENITLTPYFIYGLNILHPKLIAQNWDIQ